MDLIRAELVAVGFVLGILALALATAVATRHEPAVRSGRIRGIAPLVPWFGGLLVLLLVVRGATAGAVIVGLATVVHAIVTRVGAMLGRR